MARVKRGFKGRRRRNKLFGLAKGFRGSRKNRYKIAVYVVRRGLAFSFRDRKVRARDFRKLWIIRINAAARSHGLRYGQFIHGLKKANVAIDRSVLADLALHDPSGFAELASKAKTALAA